MELIQLPEPELSSETSIEQAIASRVSRRSFAAEPVALADVGQLLWAAQGITHERNGIAMRTAPSAGATYPLTIFLEIQPDGCEQLSAGIYRYSPRTHTLELAVDAAVRDDLAQAAFTQNVIRDAPATIVVTAEFERTLREYPRHGERYVHMEAGHVAENVHLSCESRGLNSCPVGAFDDDQVCDALSLPAELDPLYLLPFGKRETSVE